MSPRAALTLAGLLVIAESLLIFVPLAILGAAIGWPASLDLPPAEVLPLIRAELPAVRLGYGVYLLYSLLFAFVGTAAAWLAVRGTPGERSPLMSLAVSLAAVSALARAIGIIRWLTATTALGEARESGGEAAGIEAVQLAINYRGGATGELLGVALLAGLWLFVVSVLILRYGGLPRWLGLAGLGVAVLVTLPAGELFGLDLASVSLTSSVLHLWLLAVGVVALAAGRRARSGSVGSNRPEPGARVA